MRTHLLVVAAVLGACRPDPRADPPAGARGARAAAPGPAKDDGAQGMREAWWVSWRVEPRDSRVAGLPLDALDSTWVAATVLTAVTPPAPLPAAEPPDAAPRFAVDGDFNADGKPDRAIVGVYRARSGERGRFLAILTRDQQGGDWRRAWLGKVPSPNAFGALLAGPAGGGLTWLECLECDTTTEVRWTGVEYEAEIETCCDEEDSVSAPVPGVPG